MKQVNGLCINQLWTFGLIGIMALSGCGNQKDTVHSNVNMPDSCWDTYSDTWVATDALGRTMPTQEEVGNVKKLVWMLVIRHGQKVLTIGENLNWVISLVVMNM